MPALIGDILNKLSKDLFESEYFLICDPEEEITFIAKIDLIFQDYYTTRAFIESGEYFVVYDADDSPIQFTFLSIGSEHEVRTLLGCLERPLSGRGKQMNKRMRILFEQQVIVEKKYYCTKSKVEKRLDSLEVAYDEKFTNIVEATEKRFDVLNNRLDKVYTKSIDDMLESLNDQITKMDSLRAEESKSFYTSLSNRISSCEEKQKKINDSFEELDSKSELCLSRIEERVKEISYKEEDLNARYEHFEAELKISKQKAMDEIQSKIQTQLDSGLKMIAHESSNIKRNAELFVNSLKTTVHGLEILINSWDNPSADSMAVPVILELIRAGKSPIAVNNDANDRVGQSSAFFNDELTEEMPPTLEHRQNHPPNCVSQIHHGHHHLGDADGADHDIVSDPQQQELTVSTDKSAKDDRPEEGDKRHQSDDDERNMAAKRLRSESNDDGKTGASKLMNAFDDLQKRIGNHESRITKLESQVSPRVTKVELKAAFSAMTNDKGAKSEVIKWITGQYGPNSQERTQLIDKIFSPLYLPADQWPREIIYRVMRLFFGKEIEGFYHMVKRKDTGEPETRGNVRKTRQVSHIREKEFAEFLRLLFPGLPVSCYWEKYVRSPSNELSRVTTSSRKDVSNSSSGNTIPSTSEKTKEKERERK